jgi:hypothetical protein
MHREDGFTCREHAADSFDIGNLPYVVAPFFDVEVTVTYDDALFSI